MDSTRSAPASPLDSPHGHTRADPPGPTEPSHGHRVTLNGHQRPLPWSDTRNAMYFVRDHGQHLRYCYPWKSWLVWQGSHWQQDSGGVVMAKAKQTVIQLLRRAATMDPETKEFTAFIAHIKQSLSTRGKKALVESAQSEPGIPVQPEELDAHPWLLNCANGTLDLQTGVLRPHAPADLLTQCLDINYDPTATCPTWDAFLRTIQADNDVMISFLQRAVGYALTGVVREHILPILWGTGRNGKSTFLNTILALLGPYGMKAPSELLMVSKSDRHPTERADLLGKRFIAAIETEQGRKLAETFVKEATGGDPIRARRMREDFWEFWPTHTVFLATNHKPEITGTDLAIWRRVKLVKFTVTILDTDQDPALADKLRTELPGILAWAVKGCLAWQAQGLDEPDEVKLATTEYQGEQNLVGKFIDQYCLTDATLTAKVSTLYQAYKEWSGDTCTQRAFGDRLRERGHETGPRTKTGFYWKGIGLIPAADDEADDGRTESDVPF
jgi:putative DNA primase/helicase